MDAEAGEPRAQSAVRRVARTGIAVVIDADGREVEVHAHLHAPDALTGVGWQATLTGELDWKRLASTRQRVIVRAPTGRAAEAQIVTIATTGRTAMLDGIGPCPFDG